MGTQHRYETTVEWTGNRGRGTADYRAYDRAHVLRADGKPGIDGSSDPAFRGDGKRWNPEELLVGALSQCHLLQYLHLCASSGVVVVAYTDDAWGVMAEDGSGGGAFEQVVLRPSVTVTEASMVARAEELHERASALCFIASSVSFPVHHEPRTAVAG